MYLRKAGLPAIISLLSATFLLLAACGSGKPGMNELAFRDTIPCANCPGIIMELRLDTAKGSYTRKMTYLEGGKDGEDTQFSTSGSYRTQAGNKKDKTAILYILEDAPSGNEQYFLARGDTAVTALDGNGEIIRNGLNFTLRRIPR